MPEIIEPLDWDTEFFGFGIGRIESDQVSDAVLRQAEAEADEHDITCAYLTLEPEDSATPVVLQRWGYRLVDVAMTMRRPDTDFEAPPSPSKVREGTLDDIEGLDEEIDVLGPWSRFGVDPRFGPDAARAMFRAWVERAARDDERMLSIAEDEDGVTGLSAHVRGDPGRIDLMGVTRPGTRASDAMIQFFCDWAETDSVDAGPCGARNIAVLRMLERCGFGIVRCEYQFHRWFDEDVGSPA